MTAIIPAWEPPAVGRMARPNYPCYSTFEAAINIACVMIWWRMMESG